MHGNDVDDVCFSAAGIPYALQKLKGSSTSQPPTSEDRLWASRVMTKSISLNKDQAIFMLELAMKWGDAAMWKQVMKGPSCALGVLDVNMLLKAWKAFSFEIVRVR